MEWSVTVAAWLLQAGRRIYARKGAFLGVFAVVFLGSVSALAQADLLPSASRTSADIAGAAATANPAIAVARAEKPVRIEIPTIRLSAVIANPETTDAEVLDQGLLKGAVRYPTSAQLGETGNVVLFGHSSYLPIVGNQAYKTFDGIQKLVAGDVITVYSADAAYTYRVRNVAKENAASGAGISLATTSQVLTLVTCNSFATKSDRFIVTADFVESHSLSS